jgi:hypothetical protein
MSAQLQWLALQLWVLPLQAWHSSYGQGARKMTKINPQPVTLTIREIQALADRLFSRGVSHLSVDELNIKGDMLLASDIIMALIKGRSLEDTLTIRNGGN